MPSLISSKEQIKTPSAVQTKSQASDTSWSEGLGIVAPMVLSVGMVTLPHTFVRSQDEATEEISTSPVESVAYKVENKLNKKLEETIERIQQLVFEYEASIASIDKAAGKATIETTVDDEITYFDWDIASIPFEITPFSVFKIQGYKTFKGQERVRFTQEPDEEFDAEAMEMIASLNYAQNSHS